VFHEVRMGSVLCLPTVSLHTLLALPCEQLAPAIHEDIGDGTVDGEVGDTSHLTGFSNNGEYTSNTF
jgi:hypothetical protein